jgi:hypothetical protein
MGSSRVSSSSSVAGVDYRYELREGDEVVATGHLGREQRLEVGDRIEVGGQQAIVRTIEPLLLGEPELHLCFAGSAGSELETFEQSTPLPSTEVFRGLRSLCPSQADALARTLGRGVGTG